MDNPEKLAKQGTQDKRKQNKNTPEYVLDIIRHKQTQISKQVYIPFFYIVQKIY